MKVLVLFRRDLRVTDHPALTRAAAMGEVLPLYVADPEDWRLGAASGRHWDFLSETLSELREDLGRLGAPLVVRLGAEAEVVARLVRSQRIEHILLHAAPWRAARDAALAHWARGQGLGFEILPEGRKSLEAPAALSPVPGVEPGLLPHGRALGLAADPVPHRQTGGRAAALSLLERHLGARPRQAASGTAAAQSTGVMNNAPLTAERSSSRLSAHLAHGVLSGPEVLAALPGRLSPPLARQLANRMASRASALASACEESRLAPASGSRLAALLTGQTGLPFVDALARQFRATGWLDAGGRGLLASVGVHHLGLDREAVGQVLARLAVDHHPALLQRNLAAVVGGRVCDPIRAGEDHDPSGQFLRRWLPELAPVPAHQLHRPWRWTGAGHLLGRRYPEAVVDPAAALRHARDAAALRRRGLSDEAFEVIEGAAPLRLRPRGPEQLALDL